MAKTVATNRRTMLENPHRHPLRSRIRSQCAHQPGGRHQTQTTCQLATIATILPRSFSVIVAAYFTRNQPDSDLAPALRYRGKKCVVFTQNKARYFYRGYRGERGKYKI